MSRDARVGAETLMRFPTALHVRVASHGDESFLRGATIQSDSRLAPSARCRRARTRGDRERDRERERERERGRCIPDAVDAEYNLPPLGENRRFYGEWRIRIRAIFIIRGRRRARNSDSDNASVRRLGRRREIVIMEKHAAEKPF